MFRNWDTLLTGFQALRGRVIPRRPCVNTQIDSIVKFGIPYHMYIRHLHPIQQGIRPGKALFATVYANKRVPWTIEL